MSKPKHDVANALPEVELDSAGFAHGLHLLLLAIARTNPSVGAFLDEYSCLQFCCVHLLNPHAREDEAYLPVLEKFSRSARLIYQRLSKLDAEQSSALREQLQHPCASARVH
jgi:hypothetical protein